MTTLLAGTLLGCQTGTAPTAEATDPAGEGATPGVMAQGADQSLGVCAIYQVDLDPVTLAASSQQVATRSSQSANNNDSIYLLDIARYMRADTFKVQGVTRDATHVDLRYTVTHPFAAPANPSGTPNGTNRTDLGITGMALFLLDAPADPGNIFFNNGAGSQVVTNTSLITNADAYYQPAGLLAQTGAANTFPYKMLVNEAGPDGLRDGVSNGGIVTGNYGTDGWTLSELGPTAPFNQWTGYGVLHQGQAATS
ncbi:MAG: hypothetical protein ABI743_02265, partial [bacterium]